MNSPSRGAAGADLLTRVIAEIAARRDSLYGAVQEYRQLLDAIDALGEREVAPTPPPRAAVRSAPAVAKATPKVKAPARVKAQAKIKVPPTPKDEAPATTAPVLTERQTPPPGAEVVPSIERSEDGQAAAPRKKVPASGEDQQAILAALEHGSHTVGELMVVTAMTGPTIRDAVKLLSKAGKVTRTTREGKAAYALAG